MEGPDEAALDRVLRRKGHPDARTLGVLGPYLEQKHEAKPAANLARATGCGTEGTGNPSGVEGATGEALSVERTASMRPNARGPYARD